MPIDIICLAAFAYGFWQGYSRGIIRTIFNILAYVFGVVLSFKMAPTMQAILERLFNSTNPLMFVAAFVVNLLFIIFIMRIVARSMEQIFRMAYLGVVNQLLGGIVSGFIGVLLFSILLWFGTKARVVGEVTLQESKTYPFLSTLPPHAMKLLDRMKPVGKELWGTSMGLMDALEKYGTEKTETQPKLYEVPDKSKTEFEEEPQETSRPRRVSGSSGSPATDEDGIEE